ncbi:unnamed protein product [Penicillium roqueforti FM164]|uniref:Genomic scaffold, ProqFM164S01 n=1 Tax=Penicillium roqueforti (strain FM164) TaxID=1365484 RepID=W6PV57_PENRF|nr:unnamed protein product [Penicillium roqueforti FM164]
MIRNKGDDRGESQKQFHSISDSLLRPRVHYCVLGSPFERSNKHVPPAVRVSCP